jgi:hypothetical protein
MLDKSFIEKIQETAKVEEFVIEGRKYTSKGLHPVKRPNMEVLKVHTLSGLVDYITKNVDELTASKLMIHVLGHDTVDLYSALDKDWNEREHILTAVVERPGFQFGQQMDSEKFVIGLQSDFVEDEMRAKVIQLASSMKSGQITESHDDGYAQHVEVKAGISLAAKAEVPNPVTLRPFRTFIEIDQPESKFVFRVHQRRGSDDLPTCSLHQADGGRWKLHAINNIKMYLADRVGGVAIIA